MENSLISRIIVLFSLMGIFSTINDGWDLCLKIAKTGIHIQEKSEMLHLLQSISFLGIIWLFWRVLKQNEARFMAESQRITESNEKENKRISDAQEKDKRRLLLMNEMMQTYMIVVEEMVRINANRHLQTEEFVKNGLTQFADSLNASPITSLTGKIKVSFGDKDIHKGGVPLSDKLLSEKLANLQKEIEKLSE